MPPHGILSIRVDFPPAPPPLPSAMHHTLFCFDNKFFTLKKKEENRIIKIFKSILRAVGVEGKSRFLSLIYFAWHPSIIYLLFGNLESQIPCRQQRGKFLPDILLAAYDYYVYLCLYNS